MKTIIYSILIYWILVCSYKLFGNNNNLYWVIYYWVISSLFLCVVFFKLRKFTIIKKYKLVLNSMSGYWGVMTLFYLTCFFNTTLYARFAESANKLTIGAVTILIIFIFITIKAFNYDKDRARKTN